jgi:hypothetical protein
MTDSTSIHDLPTDPSGGGNVSNNISFNASEMPATFNPPPVTSLTLDQNTITQIVSGIQQASSTGATLLPSRDIPRNTEGITHDAHIQANYIPQAQKNDYIKDFETPQEILDNYNKSVNKNDALDNIYEEFQVPLLLAILFFLFQLPILKKKLYTFLPFLFFKDGNYNIQGYIFTSIFFGLLYYMLNKLMGHFNKF